jgi:hypothetical protein
VGLASALGSPGALLGGKGAVRVHLALEPDAEGIAGRPGALHRIVLSPSSESAEACDLATLGRSHGSQPAGPGRG